MIPPAIHSKRDERQLIVRESRSWLTRFNHCVAGRLKCKLDNWIKIFFRKRKQRYDEMRSKFGWENKGEGEKKRWILFFFSERKKDFFCFVNWSEGTLACFSAANFSGEGEGGENSPTRFDVGKGKTCCSIRKIRDGDRSGVIVGVFLILGCLPSARICPPYSKCWTRSYLISRRWVLLPEEDHTGKEMTQSWDFSHVFFLFISRTC